MTCGRQMIDSRFRRVPIKFRPVSIVVYISRQRTACAINKLYFFACSYFVVLSLFSLAHSHSPATAAPSPHPPSSCPPSRSPSTALRLSSLSSPSFVAATCALLLLTRLTAGPRASRTRSCPRTLLSRRTSRPSPVCLVSRPPSTLPTTRLTSLTSALRALADPAQSPTSRHRPSSRSTSSPTTPRTRSSGRRTRPSSAPTPLSARRSSASSTTASPVRRAGARTRSSPRTSASSYIQPLNSLLTS